MMLILPQSYDTVSRMDASRQSTATTATYTTNHLPTLASSFLTMGSGSFFSRFFVSRIHFRY